MKQSQIIDKLVKHDIKPSLQRIAVMQYLDLHKTHPSVDEIFNVLSKDMPTLSRTTVYNVLKLLYSKGLIQMITINEKQVLFDSNLENHAHFICKSCNKVVDLSLPETIKETQNFMIENNLIEETHVYYKGICSECLKNRNKNKNYEL